MTLLDTIKAAQLQARKVRNPVATALLTTLIGEAVNVGKSNGNRDTTDSEVMAVIKKFIANATETMAAVKDLPQEVTKAMTEIAILQSFLPQQLSAMDLEAAIDASIVLNSAVSIKDMGKVMKSLKEKYDGQFDGGAASAIIKKKLGVQ
jgi:hypothetical protein